MTVDRSELKGKNIVVTGGAGFIGSALTRELLEREANVIVYDNFLYGTKSNLADVEDRIELINGDVLSWKIYKTLKKFKVDYVFHLAAEPYIPKCYDNPEKFLEVNVKGTINVLSACKVFDVKRIVHFSSSEVYGTAKYVPMDEEHPTLPLSTYAVSKLTADRICYVFNREHGIPVVILRPFNCYGPRETQPYVIPEIISQLCKRRLVKLGNLNARRDFTYVEDTVRGAVDLLTSDVPNGEAVNLGSDKTYSVKDLVYQIADTMELGEVKIEIEPSRLRPCDVELLRCDFKKAKSYTDWEPKVEIDEGLKRTVNWYTENGLWPWERIVSGTIMSNERLPIKA